MIMLLWHSLIVWLCIRTSICSAFIIYTTRVRSNNLGDIRVELPDDIALAVVLPVFDEQDSVAASVDHITSLISAETRLYVVGNARERNTFGVNRTLEAASIASKNRHNVTILEYPFLDGRRPHQVNYALDAIKSDSCATWVLMVDVDSRLSILGLSEIISAIRCGNTIIHQPALFLGNFSSLSFAQRGHAIYQSRWTLAHEIRRILTHNYTGCFISHVVGHGLCIQLDTLNALGRVPTDTVLEDLHLGFYAAALMKKVYVVRSFEIGDCPISWKEGFEQEFRWASGAQQYPLFCRHFLSRFRITRWSILLRAIIVAFHGVVSSAAWNLVTYIFFGALIAALCGDVPSLLFVVLYLCEFQQSAFWFYRIGLLKKKDVWLTPLYTVLELARHSLSANLALLNQLCDLRLGYKKATHVADDP